MERGCSTVRVLKLGIRGCAAEQGLRDGSMSNYEFVIFKISYALHKKFSRLLSPLLRVNH